MRKPSGVDDTSLTTFEERGLVRMKAFITTGSAYAIEHGTRPSTIGHVLSTNPVALLAW
jgi:microsomal epoxide hydrolase